MHAQLGPVRLDVFGELVGALHHNCTFCPRDRSDRGPGGVYPCEATIPEEYVMTPLQVATAYHEAWTSKDLDRAMSYIADDIVCDAPAGRIEGAEAYRASMAPFVQMLLGTELLAAFGDDEKAVVVYDTPSLSSAFCGCESRCVARESLLARVLPD